MTRAVVFDLFHTLANPEDYRPPDFDRIENASAAVGLDPALVTRHWLDNLHDVGRKPLVGQLATRVIGGKRTGKDGNFGQMPRVGPS